MPLFKLREHTRDLEYNPPTCDCVVGAFHCVEEVAEFYAHSLRNGNAVSSPLRVEAVVDEYPLPNCVGKEFWEAQCSVCD